MIQLGTYNTLFAVRRMDQGVYLTDEEETEEVLLPNKFVPEDMEAEDWIKVFVFKDHENRLTATTQEPKILLNEFSLLQVRAVNEVGAFLDWGLDKDLLVPFKEQPGRMRTGNWYIVYLYIDEQTDRLVASGRYQKFLLKDNIDLKAGQQVDLLIDDRTELGVNVIINHKYRGLIYENELFQRVQRGEKRKGYIKMVREDGKIDVSLQRRGYAKVEPNADKILKKLKAANGFLPLHDKSDPEAIYAILEMSKKTFKKAIGGLYKKRIIRIENDGIYLNR